MCYQAVIEDGNKSVKVTIPPTRAGTYISTVHVFTHLDMTETSYV